MEREEIKELIEEANAQTEETKNRKLTIKMVGVMVFFSCVLMVAALVAGNVTTANKAEDEAARIAKEKSAASQEIDLGNTLRQQTVDYVIEKEEIPAYTYAQVQAMDMSKPSGVTVDDLKQVTRYKLVGTEETLYNLEQNYNINCLLLLAIASHESAYGTMQFHPNNVCGYGYSGFASVNQCLDTVGRALAKNYLDPHGSYYKGNTIDAVNKTYAADPAWDSKVAKKVTYFYKVISENHNKQLEKLQ
ncbi:MAG: glucosaminidase domain-containing protein [Firmicutes bacterium]|nr:glucosaminidase domain-containing protein [Bacillota bacterium]